MKSMKPAFYVLIVAVFAALLYVINLYKTTDGFNSDVLALFQRMTPDEKTAACKTLNEQISSYSQNVKTLVPEDRAKIYTEIDDMKKNAAAYGC
jgi:hypothetical protein